MLPPIHPSSHNMTTWMTWRHYGFAFSWSWLWCHLRVTYEATKRSFMMRCLYGQKPVCCGSVVRWFDLWVWFIVPVIIVTVMFMLNFCALWDHCVWLTHSLTAALDQLRVVASFTRTILACDLGSTNRQANVFFHWFQPCSSWTLPVSGGRSANVGFYWQLQCLRSRCVSRWRIAKWTQ